MKRKKLLVVLTIISLLLVGCGKKTDSSSKEKSNNNKYLVEKDGKVLNEHPDIVKEGKILNLTIKDIELTVSKSESIITGKVKNETKEDITVGSFDIVVKDKDGDDYITLPAYINNTIKPGDEQKFTSEVDLDLSDAVALVYEEEKSEN